MSKDQKNTKKKCSDKCGNCGKKTTKCIINLMTTVENQETVKAALNDNAFVASLAKLVSSECPDQLQINLAVVSLSHIIDK